MSQFAHEQLQLDYKFLKGLFYWFPLAKIFNNWLVIESEILKLK